MFNQRLADINTHLSFNPNKNSHFLFHLCFFFLLHHLQPLPKKPNLILDRLGIFTSLFLSLSALVLLNFWYFVANLIVLMVFDDIFTNSVVIMSIVSLIVMISYLCINTLSYQTHS